MKLKALVTMIVLGSSSLAFADHYQTQTPSQSQPEAHSRWGHGWDRQQSQLLSNDMHVAGRAVIDVGPRLRPFTKLELRSNNGRTQIDRVVIELGNGKREVVRTGGMITGKKSLTIDLPGGLRSIRSVLLIGNSRGRATIDVLAV